MEVKFSENTKETRTLFLRWDDIAALFKQCGVDIATGSKFRVGWANYKCDAPTALPDEPISSMKCGFLTFTAVRHLEGEEWFSETEEAK